VTGQLLIDFDKVRARSIQQRFDEFHQANPHVYAELVKLARRAKARGEQKVGIELLFAVCRWRRMMATSDSSSGFKLNDHYTSRYSRLIMAQERDLDGFFETREIRTS